MKKLFHSLSILIVSTSFIFAQNIDNFCGWEYNITSGSSTIAVLSSTLSFKLINPFQVSEIEISDINCDVLIGVFYENNGSQSCGGYSSWLSTNFSIAAWADDATTIEKDGFSNGEAYSFKLCIDGFGEIPFYGIMNDGPPFTVTNFTTNGLSGLASSITQVDNNLWPVIDNCPLVNQLEYQKNRKIQLTTDIYGRIVNRNFYNGVMIDFYSDDSIKKTYKF